MSLQVKLEYIAVQDSDDGVMWHIRPDPPAYIDQIGKEEYMALEDSEKDAFLTGLFVTGVTEISSKAYRLYVMKSPIYTWLEVNEALKTYLLGVFEELSVEWLAGSAEMDGTGIRLESESNRRPL